MRFFLELSYNGTLYHGWQRQPNAISVQQTVEEALTTLLGAKTAIVGAGRTDTGVHAKQMYAHFDAELSFNDVESLTFRLNRFLPEDISIRAIHKVSAAAHARFDATSRSYCYRLVQSKDPFSKNLEYNFSTPLDITAMNAAAALLLDHKNFKCFSRSKTDVKTYDCDISVAHWEKNNDKWVFYITANRFLRNMVRAIVGTLLDVGAGKLNQTDFQSILDSQDRALAGSSAPAHGLFLTDIRYPNTIFENYGKKSIE